MCTNDEARVDPLAGVLWKETVKRLRDEAPRVFAAAGLGSGEPLPPLQVHRASVQLVGPDLDVLEVKGLRVLLGDFSAAQMIKLASGGGAADRAAAVAAGAASRGVSASGAGEARPPTSHAAGAGAAGHHDDEIFAGERFVDDEYHHVRDLQRSERDEIAPEWNKGLGYSYSVAVGNHLSFAHVSSS